MKLKQVELNFSRVDGYNVSLTNNGSQWGTVYRDKEYDKALTILWAFKEIGYKDISDYPRVQVKVIKSNVQIAKGDKNEDS